MEIKVKVHRHWKESEVITRLKAILSADPHGPFKQNSGYDYQMDSGNDWWAEIRNGPALSRYLIVAHRYKSPAVMTALKVYLADVFG